MDNMENQLVRTDKFLFKVKRFFKMLFIKNNSQYSYAQQQNIEDIEIKLDKIISCKTKEQEISIKNGLAEKLMKSELSITDLADDEIEKMIQFFKDDIKLKSEELDLIKDQIVELKREKKND